MFDIKDVIINKYDKVLAVAVLIALLFSLGYLAFRVSVIRSMEHDFDSKLKALTPKYPTVPEEDVSFYQKVLNEVLQPMQLPKDYYTNAFVFIPEKRCFCVDCRRPIPFTNAVCPFCQQPQPKDEIDQDWYDGDRDGIWDAWERENGLNPFDPADASKDNDNDGFSNIAEFKARTDPNNPDSFPPLENELYIEKIVANPFKLLFKSRVTLPDGEYKFGINTRSGSKTYFVKLGEEVEGFLLQNYQEKVETENRGGALIKNDVSVLTLKRGDKNIELVKGRDVTYEEYIVYFHFELDKKKFAVKPEEEFSLRSKRYRLISVDTSGNRVFIHSISDKKDFVIDRKL